MQDSSLLLLSPIEDTEDMAIHESRIKGIETHLGNLRDRLSNIEGRLGTPPQSSDVLLITILSVVGLAIIGYWGWIGVQVVDHGKKLAAIIAQLNPAKALDDISKLDEKHFSAALPKLQSILTADSAMRQNIPQPALRTVANKLLKVEEGAPDYWTAVATTVNYQSMLNQTGRQAPDPAAISKPCVGVTAPNNFSNAFKGVVFSDCIVDLDTNSFTNVTFKDSVIQYHGGPTVLNGVQFVNCRFVLPISLPKKPEQPELLLALLRSPNQTDVRIPATH